jgi:beta-glucosidase
MIAPPNQDAWPWMDATLPAAQRAQHLAAAMTPAELAGQLLADDANQWSTRLPADCVGALYNAQGPRLAELARGLRRRHRLRVPVLFALDSAHGHAMQQGLGVTVFPSPLAMAATFDVEQLRRMGAITANEMVATGIRWAFSPNIDVARDLRFGRIEETFGEDPFLVGEMGAAFIEGLQGDPQHPRVLATAKHMTGYSEGQGGRDASECAVSWRVLRRDHLPPYRRAVQAGVASVMSGYHAIDGVPCVINRRLLRDELRTGLGFGGFVVSDADNVQWCHLLQAIDGSHADFIVRAVESGNEVQLAARGVVPALLAAVESGRLDMALLRESAALFLTAKFALGLFEEADPQPVLQVRTAQSFAAAVDAAAASIVLLENRGALPLAPTGQRVLLVGQSADDLRQQHGCWTALCRNDNAAAQIATQPDAPGWTYLAGLRARAAKAGATLAHVPACGPAPQSSADDDAAGIARAVAQAQHADVVLAIVGDSDHWVGEGRDRADMNLPGRQQALLEGLHAVCAARGKPLVVVLATTKPLALPWVQANADAVVCVWNAGMGGGDALAALLWGDRDFTGRTPVTWPAHVGQMPIHYDRLPGLHFEGFAAGPQQAVPQVDRAAMETAGLDIHHWRQDNTRHIDLPAAWVHGLWPFGHGLSYAPIHITGAQMAAQRWAVGQSPRLTVHLHNPGPRDGLAVVQIYLRDVMASVTRPDRRLAAWARVPVRAGEHASAELTLAPELLEVVDADGMRVTEPGLFHALVGFDSRVGSLRVLPFHVAPP